MRTSGENHRLQGACVTISIGKLMARVMVTTLACFSFLGDLGEFPHQIKI